MPYRRWRDVESALLGTTADGRSRPIIFTLNETNKRNENM